MFRGRIFNVWLLALVFNCVTLSLSIVENNVDRLEPVVRKSPSIEGSGDQFGFAMVPHLDTDPEELGAMNLTPNDYAAHARFVYLCYLSLGHSGSVLSVVVNINGHCHRSNVYTNLGNFRVFRELTPLANFFASIFAHVPKYRCRRV